MKAEPALWDALDLNAASPAVVAVVGGGGKTTLLYRLGREAEGLDRLAVIGGTARFRPTDGRLMPPVITTPDSTVPAAIRAILRQYRVVAASTVDEEDEVEGRFSPVSPEIAGEVASIEGLGLLALQADAGEMRPFKAPAEDEPLIPNAATHVVAVVGLDALDAPLNDAYVNEPDVVRAIAEGTPSTCDAALIARVLVSEQGGRKHVGARRFAVVVNKADLDEARALELAQAVRDAGVGRVVVASLQDEAQPVRRILT